MPSYQLTWTKQPEPTFKLHTAETDTDAGRGWIVTVSSFEVGSWQWSVELKATGRTLPSYFHATSIHQAKADAQKWVSMHVAELCAAETACTMARLCVRKMVDNRLQSFLLDTGATDEREMSNHPAECLDFLSAVAGAPVRPGDAGWVEPSFCDVSWAGILDMLGSVRVYRVTVMGTAADCDGVIVYDIMESADLDALAKMIWEYNYSLGEPVLGGQITRVTWESYPMVYHDYTVLREDSSEPVDPELVQAALDRALELVTRPTPPVYQATITIGASEIADLFHNTMRQYSPWIHSLSCYVDAELVAKPGWSVTVRHDGPNSDEGAFDCSATITAETVNRVLSHPEFRSHVADVALDEGDADTSDIFMQLACMNEIVFG